MKILILFCLLFFAICLQAESRALWVPIWELTSQGKIDTLFQDIRGHNFNQFLVQVRYRGDAAYIPNRIDSSFANNEVRYHGIKDPDFDPLSYIIEQAEKRKIEVHAWLTTFIITGHDLTRLDSSHVYFQHPEWVTSNFTKISMKHNDDMGAFLDPGIPAVQNYTLNVILDIVTNYQLDGIHLDYIRYPGMYFGFNELAKATYKSEVKYQDAASWLRWKNDQITRFVARVSQSAKEISPNLILSAAVFPGINEALEKYSQDWMFWLEKGYIDIAYTMSYTTSTERLQSDLTFTNNFGLTEKIVVGLRAWNHGNSYSAEQIRQKINIVNAMNYAGYALFSYTGIRQENYLKKLRIK